MGPPERAGPQAHDPAGGRLDRGAVRTLIASLLDCHAMVTAAAAAERAARREIGERPALRFVTAALRVDYLKPTPLVHATVSVAGVVTARAVVVAVRMPATMAGRTA